MNDHPLEELDPVLRPVVEAWRANEIDPMELSAALGRIAARPPRQQQRRWALLPAVAAAGLAALLLSWVPAAWAEVASGTAGRMVGPTELDLPALKAAWRPLVLIHVGFLLAAYPLFLAAWVWSHVEVTTHLAGWTWVSRVPGRLVGLGSLFWFVGVVLGAVWARGVLGRYWDWDPKEVMGLATLAVALGWTWSARRLRGRRLLSAGVAGIGLWLILDLWLGYLGTLLNGGHYYGYTVVPRVLLGFLALDLVVLLGVWAWLRGEAPSVLT